MPAERCAGWRMRPNEPQFELYELDLREIKTLEDIDHMLADIRRTLTRIPTTPAWKIGRSAWWATLFR